MNEDLLINIGANLTSYNKQLDNASKTFTKFTKNFASKNQPEISINLQKYIRDLKKAEDEFEKAKNHINLTAIRMKIDLPEKDLIRITSDVMATNRKINEDTLRIAEERKQQQLNIEKSIFATRKKYLQEMYDNGVKVDKDLSVSALASKSRRLKYQKELKDLGIQYSNEMTNVQLKNLIGATSEHRRQVKERIALEGQRKQQQLKIEKSIFATRKKYLQEMYDNGVKVDKDLSVSALASKSRRLKYQKELKDLGIQYSNEMTNAQLKNLMLVSKKNQEFINRNKQSFSLQQRQAINSGTATSIVQPRSVESVDRYAHAMLTLGHAFKAVALYGSVYRVFGLITQGMQEVAQEALRFNQSIATATAVLDVNRNTAYAYAVSVENLAVKYGELAAGIEIAGLALGRAGLGEDENKSRGIISLTKALEGLTAMSILTGDSVQDGAAGLASMASVYKLAGDDIRYLTNQMGAVANATRLGLKDFSTISNYALTSARALGITSKGYLALSGAMSKVGLNASTIGTSIRRLGKLATDNTKDVHNFFLQLGTDQIRFSKMLSKSGESGIDGMREFGELLLSIPKDQFKNILPNEVQMRATLTTLRQIAETKGLDKMVDKMKEYGNVTEQASKATLGINRVLASTGEAIKQMYSKEVDRFLWKLFRDTSPEQFQNSLKGVIDSVKFLIENIVELGVALSASMLLVRTYSKYSLSMLATSMVGLTGKVRGLTFSLKGLGVLLKRNPVMIATIALYTAWNAITTKQTQDLDRLYDSTHKTIDDIEKLNTIQLNALEVDNTKILIDLENKRQLEANKVAYLKEEITKREENGIVWATRQYRKSLASQKEILIVAKARLNTTEKDIEGIKTTQEMIGITKNKIDGVKESTNSVSDATRNFNKYLSKNEIKSNQLNLSLIKNKNISSDIVDETKYLLGNLTKHEKIQNKINRDKLVADEAVRKAQSELNSLANEFNNLMSKQTGTESQNRATMLDYENKVMKANNKLIEAKNKSLSITVSNIKEQNRNLTEQVSLIDRAVSSANNLLSSFLSFTNSLMASSRALRVLLGEMSNQQANVINTEDAKKAAEALHKQAINDLKITKEELVLLKSQNATKEQIAVAQSKIEQASINVLNTRVAEGQATVAYYSSRVALEEKSIKNANEKKKLDVETEYLNKKAIDDYQEQINQAKEVVRLREIDVEQARELSNLHGNTTQYRLNTQKAENALLSARNNLSKAQVKIEEKSTSVINKSLKLDKLRNDLLIARSKTQFISNKLSQDSTQWLKTDIAFASDKLSKELDVLKVMENRVNLQGLNENNISKVLSQKITVEKSRQDLLKLNLKLEEKQLDVYKEYLSLSGDTKTLAYIGMGDILNKLAYDLDNDKLLKVYKNLLFKMDYENLNFFDKFKKGWMDIVENIDKIGSSLMGAYADGGMDGLRNASSGMLVQGLDGMFGGAGQAIKLVGSLLSNTLSEAELTLSGGRVEWGDESLNNLNEMYDGANDNLLDESVKMNSYLKSMNNNFITLSKSLVPTSSIGAEFDLTGSDYVGKSSSNLWGSKDVSLNGVGIDFGTIGYNTIGEEIQGYMSEVVKKSSLFGIIKTQKLREKNIDLSDEQQNALRQAFSDGYDAIFQATSMLGLETYNQALMDVEVELGKLNLQDLNPEEAQSRIMEVYSEYFSTVLGSVEGLDEILEDYSYVGEGHLEALGRLSYELDSVTSMFTQLGSTMSLTGEKAIEISQAFINASGGLDAANTNVQGYIDNFYTDEEQFRLLEEELESTGIYDTIDDFRKKQEQLLELAGQGDVIASEQLANLLSNQNRYKDYYDYLEKLENDRISNLEDYRKNYMDAWLGDLSYLTIQQKEDVANRYATEVGTSSSALSALEIGKLSTSTKEEYIPMFNRYIRQLENEAPTSTTDDVVDRLDTLIDSFQNLEQTTRMSI